MFWMRVALAASIPFQQQHAYAVSPIEACQGRYLISVHGIHLLHQRHLANPWQKHRLGRTLLDRQTADNIQQDGRHSLMQGKGINHTPVNVWTILDNISNTPANYTETQKT